MSKYFICILVCFFSVRLLIVDRPNCIFFKISAEIKLKRSKVTNVKFLLESLDLYILLVREKQSQEKQS